MSRIPIRIRLTALFVTILTTVLLAVGTFVVHGLRSHLTTEVDRSLTTAAATIAVGYHDEGSVEFDDGTREAMTTPGSRNLGAQLVDAAGNVVRSFGDIRLRGSMFDTAALPPARGGAVLHASAEIGEQDTHVRAIAVPVTVSGRPGTLLTVEPLDATDAAVRSTVALLTLGGTLSLVLAGLGSWVVAGRALRPVERMTNRAAAIGIDALAERVPLPPARDELRRLATTFNDMLDRLRDGVDAKERLIADASHELRAPLAAMRAELDVSLRHDALADDERRRLESLREEVLRMNRLVDDLLTLARLDGDRLELLLAPQDLLGLARRVVRRLDAAATMAGCAIRVTGNPTVARCDRDRIEQVLVNVIDNAIAVSPRGGTVAVDVAYNELFATVAVCDEGPGVPGTDRERIFERFARLDPARGRGGGAGLGLAISRDIVRAHGGRLELAEPAAGVSGSTFVVSLPASPGGEQPKG